MIFAGKAARLLTRAKDIVIIAVIKRNKLVPAKMTAEMVIGVRMTTQGRKQKTCSES